MDLKDVASSRKWDTERLGNLARPLQDRGEKVAHKVIKKCSDLADCPSVPALATFLSQRDLLNPNDYKQLCSQGTQTGHLLYNVLWEASREKGRSANIVKELYLSLLDLCLMECDSWCHHAAFKILWEHAIEQLRLPEHSVHQEIDFSQVVEDAPRVKLDSSTAWDLRRRLNPSFPIVKELTFLKAILKEYHTGERGSESKFPLYDVVKAMMLTPRVGRYVSKLLPFHRSYPMEVLQFLKRLGNHWKTFALFIGFTNDEVSALSGGNTSTELKNFSKVWRMPDLTCEKNNEVLDEVLMAAEIKLESDVGLGVPPREQEGKNVAIHHVFHGPVTFSYGQQPSQGDSPQPPRRSGSQTNGHFPSLGQVGRMPGSGSSDQDSDVPYLAAQHSSTSDVDETPSFSHSYSPMLHGQWSRSDDADSEPVSYPSHLTSPEGNGAEEMLVVSADQFVVPLKGPTNTKKQFPISGPQQPQSTVHSPSATQPLIHTPVQQSQSTLHSPFPTNPPQAVTHKPNITQRPHPVIRPQFKSSSLTEPTNTAQQSHSKLRPPIKAHSLPPFDFHNIQARLSMVPQPFNLSTRESMNTTHQPLHSPSKSQSPIQKGINTSPQPHPMLYSTHKPQPGYGNTSTQKSSPAMSPSQRSKSLPQRASNPLMRTSHKSQSLTRASGNATQQSSVLSSQESHPLMYEYSNNPQEPYPTVPKSQKFDVKGNPQIMMRPLINPSLPQPHNGQQEPTRSPPNEMEISSSIGNGLYGEVFEVHPKGNEKQLYAAKEYRNVSVEQLEGIFTENLHVLNYTNLVRYFGVCLLPRDGSLALPKECRPAILMERIATNLATFLSKSSDIRPQKTLSILCDIADGLAYLHQRDIVHCDLTAYNVLLTDEGTAKIADWVNSQVEFTGTMERRMGENFKDYLPPEATCTEDGDYTYNSALDVFSFGHLSLYTITQCEPHSLLRHTYRENGKLKPRTEVERRKKYVDKMRDVCHAQVLLRPLFEFILKCLSDRAEERPPITDLKLTIGL